MRWRVVQQVASSTFKVFWRSPDAVFWTYGFPLLIIVVLGFSFRPSPPPQVPIAVVDGPRAVELVAALQRSPSPTLPDVCSPSVWWHTATCCTPTPQQR